MEGKKEEVSFEIQLFRVKNACHGVSLGSPLTPVAFLMVSHLCQFCLQDTTWSGHYSTVCNIVSIYYMDIIKGLFIIHSLLLFIIQFNLVNEEQKINIYLYTLTISSQMYYFTHLIIIYIFT